MRRFAVYVRSLNPDIPPAVRTLQLGGLLNSFGNGLVLPFLIIYLHNVRGISLALAGLIVGTNSIVSLIAGPAFGPLIDRVGGRVVLRAALAFMAVGFGGYTLVHHPWQGFVCAALAGIGNGGFWPAQSTLLATLSPVEKRPGVYAFQRMMMNLGIGLGGLVAGLIANTSDPTTFTWLFLADAATFVGYTFVLSLVPDAGAPSAAKTDAADRPGSFADVLRHRAFMAVVGLNLVLITFGLAQIDVLPAYMHNHAGVSEIGISTVFAANTLLIVLLQLPVTRSQHGRRRMRTQAMVGFVWGACWLVVPVIGGAVSGATAAALFAFDGAVLGIGECLHGTVQAPLVADLADHRLMGRYMAVSAFSWSAGFGLGPAFGGFMLGRSPTLLWVITGGVCLLAGLAAPALERVIPRQARLTPMPTGAVSGGD
ncbi:MAG TPA: MFS transporter [Gaiellales bacterium]|nr:MFS transporter [Gaiellales bacterium]